MPAYTGTITNLQIVLNTQKIPYLNQATQKNTCQNFPETGNFKPKKILQSSLSLGIRGIRTKRTRHSLFRCQVHVPYKADNPAPSITKVVDVFCLCLLKPLHFTTDLPRTRVTPLCYWDSNLVIVLDLGLSFFYC